MSGAKYRSDRRTCLPVTYKGGHYNSIAQCVRANPGSWQEARRLAYEQLVERVMAVGPPRLPTYKPDVMDSKNTVFRWPDIEPGKEDLAPFDVDF